MGGPEPRGMETRRVDALPVVGRTPKINPPPKNTGLDRIAAKLVKFQLEIKVIWFTI
jgi:hypothetical protein